MLNPSSRCPPPQSPQGGQGGAALFDWSRASRSDLRLLAAAIRQGWPVPVDVFRAALAAFDAPPRRLLAAAHVAVVADGENLRDGY